MVAPAIVLGLRGVQVLFSIIVLGLTAYRTSPPPSHPTTHTNTRTVVDFYKGPFDYGYSPHSVNFMLFTSIWTLLAVAYLVLAPTRFPRAAHKFAIGAVEFLTMLFWFAAFVAVAVRWGDAVWGYYGKKTTFYEVGVAAIVFSAFLWLSFVVTTVLAAMHIRSSPRNDTAAAPNMAGV